MKDYPWLTEAIRLEVAGRSEESLDIIFNKLDDWLCNRCFDLCSSFLNNVPVNGLSTDQLLTILTATLSARTDLPTRTSFINRVRRELDYKQENTEVLLLGLK